jgi:hypothetical protein
MKLGLIMIICGLMLIVFPQLLSFILAFILIFGGISLIYTAKYYRDHFGRIDDPFIDFFFRR